VPDISIHGWKCDFCGKEFFEKDAGKDAGYDDYYRMSIESTPCSDDRKDRYYGYVCRGCKISVLSFIKAKGATV
jgi:predicted HNH restriction endonuclease